MRPSHPPEALRLARLLTVGGIALAAASTASPAALAADTCANAVIREQQEAQHLPDCRAYELVSPSDKAAQDVRQTYGSLRSADDGSAVTYSGFGSFPGADVKGSVWMSRYLTKRGVSGWNGRSVDSRQDVQILSFASFGAQYQNIQAPDSFTSDLSVSTEQNYQVQLDPDHATDDGVVNFFRRSYTDDSYEMLSVAPAPQFPTLILGQLPEFVAATPDRQRILFETAQAMTSDPVGMFQTNLYEWDHGTIRLVGVLPDDEGGGPAAGGSVGAGGAVNTALQGHQARAGRGATLSEDGTRAFFLEGNDTRGRLFMREAGGTPDANTVWISRSEKAAPDAAEPVTFWGTVADGSQALFISAERLVDSDADDRADLYRYSHDAPAGSRLTRLSAGDEPAGVLGVLGSALDQSVIYFAATGKLTGGAPSSSQPKVYRWTEDGLQFVAELSGDVTESSNWDPALAFAKSTRVTDDGRYLLFASRAQLTDYANRGFNEIYLFDTEAPAGEEISCVSCREDGSTPTGDAVIGYADPMAFQTAYLPRTLIPHGNSVRVFFDTYDAITAEDGNARRDAYVYDHDTGTTSLLSSGRDASDSYFMDASVTGDDAFITTRTKLSRWDRDPLYDVYDVRVGANLAEPAESRSCVDSDCQGPPSQPPGRDPMGSSTFNGPGDIEEQLEPEPRPVVRGNVTIVRSSRATAAVVLRVKTPGAGNLTVTGRNVRTVRRSVSKAATYTLRVKLSPKAKKRLGEKRRLRVAVRVAFAPRTGQRSSANAVVVLKGRR